MNIFDIDKRPVLTMSSVAILVAAGLYLVLAVIGPAVVYHGGAVDRWWGKKFSDRRERWKLEDAAQIHAEQPEETR